MACGAVGPNFRTFWLAQNRRKLMAQKVLVSLVDDLDGSEADETVEFGLDGINYQIDLSTENAEELRDALAQ